MALIEGAFRHASLSRFTTLRTIAFEGAPELVVARPKSGTLVVVKVLLDRPVPPEIASQLSRERPPRAR